MESGPSLERRSQLITVTELNRRMRELVERSSPVVCVAGEISNFVRAASGHCYFSLKDAHAQVRCVMFRQKMQLHDWRPENGLQVEVRAFPSFYEARGEFQLNVESMSRSGRGALYAAFEQLKAKLLAEGLFDEAHKRPVPRFPRAIGIVTSLQAAALRDVLTTLRRRMPAIPVIVYPTAVQGDAARQQIASAIALADARAECDVLIVCRGGGSIEDLWAFNDEGVARAIHACQIVVVSAVGHETDFTIADFIADARAATPTAAAQLVTPDRLDLLQELSHLARRLGQVTHRAIERRMQQLDILARRLLHPGERVANQLRQLDHLASRMGAAWERSATDRQWRLRELAQEMRSLRPDVRPLAGEQKALARRLEQALRHRVELWESKVKNFSAQLTQLNPQTVLERGYSIVETESGSIVRDSAQFESDSLLRLSFARGTATARVTDKS